MLKTVSTVLFFAVFLLFEKYSLFCTIKAFISSRLQFGQSLIIGHGQISKLKIEIENLSI